MPRLSYLYIGCLLLIGVAIRIGVSHGAQTSPGRAEGTHLSIPFVGCKSDGQAGPLEIPQNARINVGVGLKAARLAIYKAGIGDAVLGPRGWFCFAMYGSGGATLYITPEPLKPAPEPKSFWDKITGPIIGPVIKACVLNGDTSGRYAVAEIVARVFPMQRLLAERLLAEVGMSVPSGPFPGDRLTYLNERTVEYETPGNSEGLGTSAAGDRLRQNINSIRGVAILETDFYLHHLAVRMPRNMTDLGPVIIRQFEESH